MSAPVPTPVQAILLHGLRKFPGPGVWIERQELIVDTGVLNACIRRGWVDRGLSGRGKLKIRLNDAGVEALARAEGRA